MDCTAYTNHGTIENATKANTEAFYNRLKKLYPCVDDVSQLPQAWSPDSKAPPLGLTYENRGCYFRGNGRRDEDEKYAAAVRTDHYIPPSCLLYYFEIKFISRGREGFMGVGLSSAQVLLTKLPGWARESYGYHADDGNTFTGDGRGHPFGPTFTTGDVIGCGYNLVEGKCFFTKNGINLGTAFDDIPGNVLLYPTIGLKTPGEEIVANFGQQDFEYEIEQDLRSLRKNMTMTISSYPISDFSDWQTTLHKLVQSWLLQNSYPNTADAFSRSAKIECIENLQRIQQRNQIQQLVLGGRISEAIRLTNRLCPNLLQNNPNLLFTLKCRQFIELIGGAESDYSSNFNCSGPGGATNGVQGSDANGDQPNPPGHQVSNNGCDVMIGCSNGEKMDSQQSASTSSIQEPMDIDLPSDANDNSHRKLSAAAAKNNTLSVQHQTPNKLDTNGKDRVNPSIDTELDEDEVKFARLLQFGQELSENLQQLDEKFGKNESNEKMLHDAVALIAFTNPRNSCLGKLLDPTCREPISQLLNNSIVKAEMGDSSRPPLEEIMNHLRNLVRLNDSHGGWLIDQLY